MNETVSHQTVAASLLQAVYKSIVRDAQLPVEDPRHLNLPAMTPQQLNEHVNRRVNLFASNVYVYASIGQRDMVARLMEAAKPTRSGDLGSDYVHGQAELGSYKGVS